MVVGAVRRVWVVSFVVVLVGGQLAVGMRAADTASVTGDEPFYLLTTQSLSSDADLDLTDEYRNGEELTFWDGTVPLWRQMKPAPDGRLLSPHQPGLSLLTLPAFSLGGLGAVRRFLVLAWAAAMACAAVLGRRAGAPPWAAVLGAVVVGAGAPGVVYASQVYPEGPAALCVSLGLLLATGGRPRPLLMAITLVALAWLGVKYVPVGAVIAGAWAWRFRHEPRAVGGAAVLMAGAAAHYAWWHLLTFGGLTPYGTNVVWAGEGTATILGRHVSLTGRAYRLYGLFLDARFGLLRWLPASLLAAWGFRRRTGLHGAVLGVSVLMGTFVWITMMGWWFPGRPLVVAFPALAVAVGLGAARLPRLATVLSAWSAAVAVALVWAARTGRARLAVDPFELGLPLPPGWLFPDFRSFTWRQALLSAAWVTAIATAVWATRRREAAIEGPGRWGRAGLAAGRGPSPTATGERAP